MTVDSTRGSPASNLVIDAPESAPIVWPFGQESDSHNVALSGLPESAPSLKSYKASLLYRRILRCCFEQRLTKYLDV